MKKFFFPAIVASLVLSVAAVYLGGLNQDEGWYLYTAQLINDGKLPYRDFAYTQGPLMPIVYSFFAWTWQSWGILGARIFTLLIGLAGVVFASALARRLSPGEHGKAAALAVFMLLGCNLYHIYYLAIPKTYALTSLFLTVGFYLLSFAGERRRYIVFAAVALAFAGAVRISFVVLLPVVGAFLLFRRRWADAVLFAFSSAIALAAVYGVFLFDDAAREGLIASQRYHTARGGTDIVWTIGSVSRLVRWYLPVFIVFGMGFLVKSTAFVNLLAMAFAAVFAVQMLAPFPYEDYQVPVMALLSIYAAVKFFTAENVASLNFNNRRLLLVLGLVSACSFGSPMLEKWTVNGQDRFWSRKKEKCELAQLRDVAARIEKMDPGGKELLTQDLYLAIETGRRVPKGLEMGPFAMLKDEEWRNLLENATCRIAALSGYSFAIDPPVCTERPIEKQMEYWGILKKRYRFAWKEDDFGQNSTTLIVLEKNNGK